jgi:hypothetical protein
VDLAACDDENTSSSDPKYLREEEEEEEEATLEIAAPGRHFVFFRDQERMIADKYLAFAISNNCCNSRILQFCDRAKDPFKGHNAKDTRHNRRHRD